jgi:hypothetical protein
LAGTGTLTHYAQAAFLRLWLSQRTASEIASFSFSLFLQFALALYILKTQIRSLYLFLLFLPAAGCAYAQDVKVKKPVLVGLSAYYDFPKSFGVAGSAEFTLRSKQIFIKTKKQQQKTKYRDWIFTADAGFYHYPLQ